MSLNLKKIVAVFFALTISSSLLSSCSSVNSQKAIIFLQDNTENRSIEGNMIINAAGDKPVSEKMIIDAAKASKSSKKFSKTEWNPDCNNGEGCSELNGKPLSEVSVDDYFEKSEGFEVDLPVNDSGKVELHVTDGKFAVKWALSKPKSKDLPVYISLVVDDVTIGVTELLNGKASGKVVKISSLTPKNSWYFEEEYDYVSDYRAERDNKWLLFSIMYKKYVNAVDEANTDTCKVFGKNCDGNASYSEIGKVYRKAYDDVLTPMLSEIITNSEDRKVSVALLKLKKAAELQADCYFRTYSAAEGRNDTAYSATSECFSDVKQQISDIEIYLEENSQSIRFPMIYGGY
jgi:hypothetical protein